MPFPTYPKGFFQVHSSSVSLNMSKILKTKIIYKIIKVFENIFENNWEEVKTFILTSPKLTENNLFFCFLTVNHTQRISVRPKPESVYLLFYICIYKL